MTERSVDCGKPAMDAGPRVASVNTRSTALLLCIGMAVGIVITGLLWMVTAKPRPDYSMELFEVRLGSRISRMDAGAMDAIYAGNAREGAVRLAEVAAAENLLLPEKQSHEPFGPSPTEMRALREFERCGEARIYAAFLRLKYPQWQWERQPGSGAE